MEFEFDFSKSEYFFACFMSQNNACILGSFNFSESWKIKHENLFSISFLFRNWKMKINVQFLFFWTYKKGKKKWKICVQFSFFRNEKLKLKIDVQISFFWTWKNEKKWKMKICVQFSFFRNWKMKIDVQFSFFFKWKNENLCSIFIFNENKLQPHQLLPKANVS